MFLENLSFAIKRSIKFQSMMSREYGVKRMRLCHKDDRSYFDSYADIAVHEEMLSDEVRTNAYKKAIFSCSERFKNKVVLDVGAGTGILSVFCAKAGARKVYAVEASNIAQQAQKIVKLNGVGEKVEIIQGILEDISLPEKVDIIVSEWMGYCLLYESMLTSVIVARDRWLKEGGLILPCEASIHLVPICDDEIVCEKVNFWNDMSDCYGVDMSCLAEFARTSFSKEVMVKSISCENILSQPRQMARFDLYTVQHDQLNSVRRRFAFKSFGMADLQGFALWFDVAFPTPSSDGYHPNHHKEGDARTNGAAKVMVSNELHGQQHQVANGGSEKLHGDVNNSQHGVVSGDGIVLSTSPFKPETHWKQSILYLEREHVVEQDTLIEVDVEMSPNSTNKRFLDIKLDCEVKSADNEVKRSHQTFLMGYETPTEQRKSNNC